jgi:L-ascorbate metabolism protein UlaG (beta-lactamase superfamily)
VDLSWLGHACFRLRGRDVTIVTDPYVGDGDGWGYPPLSISADVVTISNDHPHHAGVAALEGKPHVLRGPGEYEIGGALIWGVRTSRRPDGANGAPRKNTAFIIQLEELTICHLGDLAHAPLTSDELTHIKDADVLLIPVGGNCTINAQQAAGVVAQVEPRLIVPMHYATDETRGSVALDDVSRFCKELGATEVAPRSRVSITPTSLPSEPTVMLLEVAAVRDPSRR